MSKAIYSVIRLCEVSRDEHVNIGVIVDWDPPRPGIRPVVRFADSLARASTFFNHDWSHLLEDMPNIVGDRLEQYQVRALPRRYGDIIQFRDVLPMSAESLEEMAGNVLRHFVDAPSKWPEAP